MHNSTLLAAPEVPASAPLSPRWVLGAIQTILGLGLLAPFGYRLSTTQELLVGFSLLNASMLLVGG
ncbi:hypothetical protein [Hymenobacter metallicola]|uniref:Uncharacterized protein n=1 Tax=Hymenobacter metallicola TaxID=2563114 RepID=A0A4Z0QGF4_9BACT|nr:hypothetical protein [Hymenobacter metallicola]TGE28409.1 hypothetical protein E5K02_02790 [Hymenobacter metallicola]